MGRRQIFSALSIRSASGAIAGFADHIAFFGVKPLFQRIGVLYRTLILLDDQTYGFSHDDNLVRSLRIQRIVQNIKSLKVHHPHLSIASSDIYPLCGNECQMPIENDWRMATGRRKAPWQPHVTYIIFQICVLRGRGNAQ
jgi:hypothetical protein